MAGSEMSTIEALMVAISMPRVVLDSADPLVPLPDRHRALGPSRRHPVLLACSKAYAYVRIILLEIGS